MTDSLHPYFDANPMAAMLSIAYDPPPTPTSPPPSPTVVMGEGGERGEWSSLFLDFVGKCLDKDPGARPSCLELLKHPWLVGEKIYHPVGGKEGGEGEKEREKEEGEVVAVEVVKELAGVATDLQEEARKKESEMMGKLLGREWGGGKEKEKGGEGEEGEEEGGEGGERLISFRFPDGSSQRLLVHQWDTREG